MCDLVIVQYFMVYMSYGPLKRSVGLNVSLAVSRLYYIHFTHLTFHKTFVCNTILEDHYTINDYSRVLLPLLRETTRVFRSDQSFGSIFLDLEVLVFGPKTQDHLGRRVTRVRFREKVPTVFRVHRLYFY